MVSQNIVNSGIVAHNKMALKTAKSMLNPSILGSFMDLQTKLVVNDANEFESCTELLV